jgi:hypothetical protein
MAVIVVAVVSRVVTVVVVMVITAMLSQLLRPSSSQLLPPCCRSRHGRVVMVVVVVAVAVVAAMLAQLSQPLWLLLSWPSWCRCCGIAVSLLQSLWPCCRSRCGHHCHGWSWSVVVAVGGRSLSVGHRRQLSLLVMAVTVTHLVVGAARHHRHPWAHRSEGQTSMGPCTTCATWSTCDAHQHVLGGLQAQGLGERAGTWLQGNRQNSQVSD